MNQSRIDSAIALASHVDGYMCDAQLRAIAGIAKDSDSLFIEIGVYHGRTTRMLAELCGGRIISIDHFSGTPTDLPEMAQDPQSHKQCFENNLREYIDSGKVELLDATSAEASSLLCGRDVKADAIFIDGNHDYESTYEDITNYLPLVKPGGVLFGHDYAQLEPEWTSFPGVAQAVGEFFKHIEIDNGIWIYRVPKIAVPKIIHRIWLGGNPIPDEFAVYGATWQAKHPGWEMRLWTESDLANIDMQNRDLFDRPQSLAAKSNIARLEVLYLHGGVYVDTDFECICNIEQLIGDAEQFAAYQDSCDLCNAFLGCTKENAHFKRLLDALPGAM